MAKSSVGKGAKVSTNNPSFKKTSIGASNQTRPSSKAQKRSYKKYRGQGR